MNQRYLFDGFMLRRNRADTDSTISDGGSRSDNVVGLCFYDSPPSTVDCMKEKTRNIYPYRRPNKKTK